MEEQLPRTTLSLQIPEAHRHARNDIGSMSREGSLRYESHWWIIEVCVVPRPWLWTAQQIHKQLSVSGKVSCAEGNLVGPSCS